MAAMIHGSDIDKVDMKQDRHLPKHLCYVLALVCAAPMIRAQQPGPVTLMQQSSAEVLKQFEPDENQEYALGPGDEISVIVNAMPELSGKHILGPDGRITLPLAADIEIDGMTRSQAAAAIRSALSAYYQSISVTVSVDRYVSNHILLLGAVERPGLLSFDGPPNLLEVVARGEAGTTFSQTASGPSVSSNSLATPAALPEVCLIYRGAQTLVAVRLRDLVKSGDPKANLRLKRDDVVFVPGNEAYVSILGSVLHPGLLRLESTSTLPQLLAAAGGLTDKGGRYPKIYIVHAARGNVAGSIDTVSFENIVEARPSHQTFESGDIIYVPENGFNRAADVLQKVSPLISLITVGALLR